MKKGYAVIAGLIISGVLIFSSCQNGQPPVSAKEEPPVNIEKNMSNTIEQLKTISTEKLYGSYLDMATKELIDFPTLINRIKDSRVIYVGEYHTNEADHKLQSEIIKALSQNHSLKAIAMEFLYRVNQPQIDDFTAGKISSADLYKIAGYGFGDWYGLYERFFNLAKENNLKLVALNVSREIKGKMARMGWDNLTDDEKKLIARDIDTTNQAHREHAMKAFQGMVEMMKRRNMSPPDMDMLYFMQCVWDETFGEAIANYLKSADKNTQIVVIAGAGHIEYKFDIPERSYKRYPASYKTIVPVELDDARQLDPQKLFTDTMGGFQKGDFIYFSPKSPPEMPGF